MNAAQRIVVFIRLAAIAVTLVSGCVHTPKTSLVPATGVIAGRITDERGLAVPQQYHLNKRRGIVTAMPLWSDYVKFGLKTFDAFTGADGMYSIPNVPVGTYVVTGRMDGFDTQFRDSVRVSAHGKAIVNFRLKETVKNGPYHGEP